MAELNQFEQSQVKGLLDLGFNANILKFDLKSLRYFVDDKKLAYKLKQVQ